jgi:hypothetical protein
MTAIHRTALVSVAILSALALTSSRSSADDIVEGPNSAYASANVVFPVIESNLLSMTIPQGKAGRVLVVHATIIDSDGIGATNQTYYYQVRVGGAIEPTADGSFASAKVQSASNISPFATVTSSGTWWIDLDAAGLVGVPLQIDLFGSTWPDGPAGKRRAQVSMAAVMELK